MNQIIKGLYIGNMNDGRSMAEAMSVLCVMWEKEPGVTAGVKQIATTHYHDSLVGVYADSTKMDEAADWIHMKLELGERVLVHCAYGIERSPLTVVWYLMRYRNLDYQQAYDLVLTRRPEAQHRGTWMPVSIKLNGVLPERATRVL